MVVTVSQTPNVSVFGGVVSVTILMMRKGSTFVNCICSMDFKIKAILLSRFSTKAFSLE